MIDACFVGDVRDGLRAFAAAGIKAQTCVTSPPYWGLRDYGMPGQLGLEASPAEYVARMVEVFRGVRDVLADDGTLWLNLGDSYANAGGVSQPHRNSSGGVGGSDGRRTQGYALAGGGFDRPSSASAGLKPKDLCGIPWRVAFALQEDGWYLRSDIIWSKPNPMPESVTDRPTKAHEYLFLLAKSERYFYDHEAILEPISAGTHERYFAQIDRIDDQAGSDRVPGKTNGPMKAVVRKSGNKLRKDGAQRGCPSDSATNHRGSSIPWEGSMRNKRTVWTVTTTPYSDAHFAVMPCALVEPCVLAGSRVGDVVLDPFLGSGTTAQVAQALGRHWIGCELNPAYVAMQAKRTAQSALALGAA